MRIKLKFLGAAGNVTGSCYLLEANKKRLLVDCGLYQEHDLKSRNWQSFPVPPKSIDAVLLTHAHLDHCGRLPRLVKEGFRGKIYCTDVTGDIAEIMLIDSGSIQEEDARYKKKRHDKEGRKGPYPEIPLYTAEDAKNTMPFFKRVRYGKTVNLGKGISATFRDAGHVLGSAMIMVTIRQGTGERTILFSGDIGRWDKPILKDPTVFEQADYVLVESTYGNRLLESVTSTRERLKEVILSTLKTGGNLVIPTFALERAQELLYHLRELRNERRIPMVMTFLDSPMAVNITDIFEHHPGFYDAETLDMVRQGLSPFQFPGLKMVRTGEESRAINSVRGTAIILAGSGMCTGGRIKHHLVANISRPESTVLFVGYQARNTMGREIVDGATTVRILGQRYPVSARIERIDGFSAHADRDELVRWLSGLKTPPGHIFVVHGEQEVAEEFRDLVKAKMGWNISVPAYLEETSLE